VHSSETSRLGGRSLTGVRQRLCTLRCRWAGEDENLPHKSGGGNCEGNKPLRPRDSSCPHDGVGSRLECEMVVTTADRRAVCCGRGFIGGASRGKARKAPGRFGNACLRLRKAVAPIREDRNRREGLVRD